MSQLALRIEHHGFLRQSMIADEESFIDPAPTALPEQNRRCLYLRAEACATRICLSNG